LLIEEDFRESLQGGDCAGKQRGQGGSRGGVPKGLDYVLDASKDEVISGGEGHGDLGREPFQGVGNAFLLGLPNVGPVATVGVKGRAKVPSIDAVWGPGGTVSGLLMD